MPWRVWPALWKLAVDAIQVRVKVLPYLGVRVPVRHRVFVRSRPQRPDATEPVLPEGVGLDLLPRPVQVPLPLVLDPDLGGPEVHAPGGFQQGVEGVVVAGLGPLDVVGNRLAV